MRPARPVAKRRMLVAVALGGVLTGGVVARGAFAEQRTQVVTLPTGQTVTVTVDVPPPAVTVPPQPPSRPPVQVHVQPGGRPSPSRPPSQSQPAAPPAGAASPPSSKPRRKTGHPRTARARAPRRPLEWVAATLRRSKPQPRVATRPPKRAPDGVPTPADPTFSLALPGPAPIGVPNFFIDKFRVPPFLLPIYQAAGIEYGLRWEVLAAINEIETDYGRNLNVSTAGAVGWMQFLPSTWRRWGVDANGDRRTDPYNPVDAIFTAARYLKAAGAPADLRRAVFAYNHADWYVDSVLLRARLLGGLPADFVGSLTGLTEGRFPVSGRATYADELSAREATRRINRGHNAAVPVEARSGRRSIDIFARSGTPVIAVQDGKVIRRGANRRLGRFVMLRDAYGNTYTYAHLKKLARTYPVPRPRRVSRDEGARELALPAKDPAPRAPATAGHQLARSEAAVATPRLTTVHSAFTKLFAPRRRDRRHLRTGSQVIAGTILGRIGRTSAVKAPRLTFEIRPAGRGAPRIDPKPILDGWKLLESTAIYRARGHNPFYGRDAHSPTVGQVLLMSKQALQRRVLDDPSIDIYPCGRSDIEAGQIDRRVLAALEFLTASGLKPTVTSLRCGHSEFTSGGNVSEHSSGDAVDIAKIDGIPVLGHQGPGSITDITVRRLLTLQGVMQPHQIITLMAYPGADNTLALPDHNDHIHIGFRPLTGTGAQKFDSVLKPRQWDRLIERLATLENPTVALQPSRYALPVRNKGD